MKMGKISVERGRVDDLSLLNEARLRASFPHHICFPLCSFGSFLSMSLLAVKERGRAIGYIPVLASHHRVFMNIRSQQKVYLAAVDWRLVRSPRETDTLSLTLA
jgi:hypothetical protein